MEPTGNKAKCYKEAYKRARKEDGKSRREAREIAQALLNENRRIAQARRDTTPFNPNSDTTSLYRFMNEMEYNATMNTHRVSINPDGSGFSGKQFGFNVNEITQLRDNMDLKYSDSSTSRIVEVIVPTSALAQIGDFNPVDESVLYSGSVTIPINSLSVFNNSIIKINDI